MTNTAIARRAAIGGALAVTVMSLMRTPAQASTPKITLVVEPHPDDTPIRLIRYVAQTIAVRGDLPILIAASSGGGSAVARGLGWSPEHEREYRMAEQARVWSALTGGTGQIIRLNQWDLQVKERAVRDAINRVVADHPGSTVEAYAAAHSTDRTGTADVDHRAVAEAVRLSKAPIKRWALEPGSFTKGNYTAAKTPANVRNVVDRRIQLAFDASWFGRKSASSLFRALQDSNFQNRVVQS